MINIIVNTNKAISYKDTVRYGYSIEYCFTWSFIHAVYDASLSQDCKSSRYFPNRVADQYLWDENP